MKLLTINHSIIWLILSSPYLQHKLPGTGSRLARNTNIHDDTRTDTRVYCYMVIHQIYIGQLLY